MHDITTETFRSALSHVPTSVVVVTGSTTDGPAGLAIGSFVSVSLDPLLIGFFPARTSSTWPGIRTGKAFCVNVLADDQIEVSRRFASRGGNKFAGLEWRPAPSGAPILTGCVLWIDCEVQQEIASGDHVLVLGRVTALEVERNTHALVFHRGDYTSTAAAALSEGEA